MAKLFKHLGLGGGGGKRGSGTSNSPQCDRVRQLFPEQSSPPGHGSPISSSLSIGDTETDSSAASTISSANRSTVGSEDFPNPPPSWLNSSNASMIVSSNSSSTFVADLNGSGNKEQANMKMANIYENQEVFAESEKSKLFNEDCWNEVKIWLQEMSNPASLSSTHQPTQSDIDNARFLAEILSALQKVRSEIFPSESEGRPIALIQAPGHSDRNGKTGMRVGNMLSEVVMKLESEYERARKSLTSKDYERYTRLKELLRFEIQEPIYGLQEFIARPLDDCLGSADALLPPMVESCFYDEPWNSDDVHVELEDQFQVSRAMATSSGSNNGVVTSSESSTAEFLQAAQSSLTSSPHEVDARTRTGYEPPWDWKPHQKDGRREEGYEKPWDLKPHHKDSRPSKEYEEPWDHKGPRVESDLMAAKMAKEARESGLADAEDSQQLQKKYKDHKLPAKDYEDPWDQKTKEIECDLIAAKIAKVTARIGMPTIISTKAAEDGGPKAVPGVSDPTSGENQMKKKKSPAVPVTLAQQHCTQPIQHQTSQQHQQFFSPFKKPLPPLPSSASQSPLLSQADSPRMRLSEAGGSSNVQLTLGDQIWYHGAIGRSEAENLLHKQREASFLVRKSENSPNDYSLSVRSNRGFMHLKIVTDSNGRYILGQFSQPFISIPQMVQYYTSSKLPIKGAEHTSLHHPVPRGSP